jgi:hypothetical protein
MVIVDSIETYRYSEVLFWYVYIIFSRLVNIWLFCSRDSRGHSITLYTRPVTLFTRPCKIPGSDPGRITGWVSKEF